METMEIMETGTHFAILKLGVSIWNQWRAAEPLTVPNLKNADLSALHLENINLCRANLRGAKLNNAYLFDADFQGADLREANLTRALLIGANLHKANLTGAVLKHAYLAQSDLSNANFTGASLQKADLKDALLTEATFANARIAEAELATSLDLTQSQLNSTKDAHLACFDTAMPAGLITPTKIPATAAVIAPAAIASKTVQKPSQKSVGRSAGIAVVSEMKPLQAKKTATKKAAAKKAAAKLQPVTVQEHPIDVFQPATREPKLSRPVLRQLAAS